MRLVDDIASSEDKIEVPSVEDIKSEWHEEQQSLVKLISKMKTFHEDVHPHPHTHTKNLQRLLSSWRDMEI